MGNASSGQMNPVQGLITLVFLGLSMGLLATPYYLFAVVPGCALLFFMALLKRPQLAYYLIIFLIPFGAFRGLSGPLQFLRLHWVLALCLVGITLFDCLIKKRLPTALRASLWPHLMLLLAIAVISALFSRYPEEAYKNVLLLCAAYVFIAINMTWITPYGFKKTLPGVIMLSVSLSSIFSVLGYFFDVPLFAEHMEAGGFKRGVGTSTDPNNMSLMIIFTIPFLVHWAIYTRRFLYRCLAMSLICINCLGLVTTFSRGGALIMVLVGVGLLIEYGRRLSPLHLGFISIGALCVLIAGYLVIPEDYWHRQKSLADHTEKAVSRRFSYLIVGWDAFKQKPVLGHGPGTFKSVYAGSAYAGKYAKSGEGKYRYAHNTYLEVLTGMGAAGIVVFLTILGLSLKSLSKAKKRYLSRNEAEWASLVGAYRLSFIGLLLFLFLFSDLYHKYLLLSLAVSQAALRFSCVIPDRSPT